MSWNALLENQKERIFEIVDRKKTSSTEKDFLLPRSVFWAGWTRRRRLGGSTSFAGRLQQWLVHRTSTGTLARGAFGVRKRFHLHLIVGRHGNVVESCSTSGSADTTWEELFHFQLAPSGWGAIGTNRRLTSLEHVRLHFTSPDVFKSFRTLHAFLSTISHFNLCDDVTCEGVTFCWRPIVY